MKFGRFYHELSILFDAQYWKENPLDCIVHISQDQKKEIVLTHGSQL